MSDGLRADPPQGTRVTATDLATGESETVEIKDDYVVTCDGRAYVDGVQAYANGTHIVTIKREPAPCAVPVGDTPPNEPEQTGPVEASTIRQSSGSLGGRVEAGDTPPNETAGAGDDTVVSSGGKPA